MRRPTASLDHRGDGQIVEDERRLLNVLCCLGVPVREHRHQPGIVLLLPRRVRQRPASSNSREGSSRAVVMLQQYQQQPDYTPYGGIGYGAQPNAAAGYYNNYGASESSWYGSPSPVGVGDHSQNMVSSLSLSHSLFPIIIRFLLFFSVSQFRKKSVFFFK